MKNAPLVLVLAAACSATSASWSAADLAIEPGTCAGQDDCAAGSVCQPASLGALVGACQPPSTRHCANCAADADCGANGLCFQAPGDVAPACHIDCSLSYLACPTGYNCLPVLHGDAGQIQVCVPVDNQCAHASGGSCTSGETQPCTVSNDAGTCTGERVCASGQFGPCNAAQPALRPSCDAPTPAGCTELPAPAALATPGNCGACGNACPTVASGTADAACIDPTNSTCGISCRDDNYDINGDPADGCEVPDPDPGNHDQTSATAFPSTTCSDSTSQNTFGGVILSDTRVHTNPTVNGFVARAGAAPHWFSVYDSGGLTCTDDYAMTFMTSGGPAVPCYVATIITDKTSNTVTVTGAGSATVSGGAGSYTDNSTVYFKVEKTCSTTSIGDADVTYSVNYHL
jgi:hypothetical protein